MQSPDPNIVEFKRDVSGHFSTVVETGRPLKIRKHKRPHVTVLPASLAEQALAALREKEAAETAALKLLDELPVSDRAS